MALVDELPGPRRGWERSRHVARDAARREVVPVPDLERGPRRCRSDRTRVRKVAAGRRNLAVAVEQRVERLRVRRDVPPDEDDGLGPRGGPGTPGRLTAKDGPRGPGEQTRRVD